MADSRVRKRPKKIREDASHEKPTKEEIAIAKHLRFQLPTKKTTFMQENVEYFTGSKAVDFLLESKWATGKKGVEALFTTRASVVAYMNRLMQKRMFYRTIKTVKRKREKDAKSKDKELKEKDSKQNEKESKKKEKDSKMKDKETKKKDAESDEKKVKKQEKEEEEENETNEKDTKKGKKKVVLDFADNQSFKDNLDAYVWVYDPIKTSHYILGFTLVIAAIGICIYPLWPPEIKIGTYYLSLVGAGFVGSILVLGVFRFILFTFLWALTIGKLHFWLFPNLLEDVSVQESFQPIYTKEWRGGDKKEDKKEDQNEDDDKDSEKDETKKEDDGAETQEENDEERGSDSKNEECEKTESASEENNGSEAEGEETAGQLDFEVIGKDEISAVEE